MLQGSLIMLVWASWLTETVGGREVVRAMPVLLVVLLVMVIAYRFYSAFLAAKVAALDDSRPTPAHVHNDGQNYHPTNKWVLFGHHFAAISGAGPLIGPVLAMQYGYMPGLLWLLIGVCLAGAVQDMLVLAASVRRGGKSLAQIAFTELGRPASIIVSMAILVIVVIALAGLGAVVVKALGGEEAALPKDTVVLLPENVAQPDLKTVGAKVHATFPSRCQIRFAKDGLWVHRSETFVLEVPSSKGLDTMLEKSPEGTVFKAPDGSRQIIAGSSWGTFTIACTIPIALFVSMWMYRIRKGKVMEASVIGAVGVIGATILGGLIPGSFLEPIFSLSQGATIFALCAYGFVASVLPVWLLLCPRDYISSFLKLGTIALLILGVMAANPPLQSLPLNRQFEGGSEFFKGDLFPFVFICIMCGAISGFHALVSSGTTPKMIDKESHVRPIGYGSMLLEGLVGVVALIAAASMPVDVYWDINTPLRLDAREEEHQKKYEAHQKKLQAMFKEMGLDEKGADPLLNVGGPVAHLDLGELEKLVEEPLRGRTGGAVTLAAGMADIFTQAMNSVNVRIDGLMKYWYHFAIMFEALFILTTIDTGTRIARFLMQETLGKLDPRFERTDWLPGAVLATAVVTAGWGALVATGSIGTIWPMFGIANQLLAVLALCLVTTLLINSGKGRYAPVTLLPMLWVTTTTMTAGVQMSQRFVAMIGAGNVLGGVLNLALTLFVMISVGTIVLMAAARWLGVSGGLVQPTNGESDPASPTR